MNLYRQLDNFLVQKGETQLAAAGLGMSYCNLVGFAQLVGLDTATQTLSAQSFGAGNLFRYGVILQRAVILQLTWALIILPLWINSEKILLKLGQEKDVARIAGLFINTRIPSLLLQGIYSTMKTYLLCQEISTPLVVNGFIGLVFSVVANYLFVSYLDMGLVGSAIVIDLTYLVLCLLLLCYIWKKRILQAWPGWSGECLLQWGQFVKLALPGALMVIFDWGSAETGVFLMGLVGKVEVGTQSVVFNLLSTLFMISLSFAIAVSVKVGSYLGSGEPQKAIDCSKVAVFLFLILGVFDGVLLMSLRDYIGYVFSKSKNVIRMISSVCPIIAAYHILDGTQGIVTGIMRGIGLQKHGAVINFIGYMVAGLPLGAVLALVVHLNVFGFWSGMAVGMALQVILALILLVCSNWDEFARKARKRAEVPDLKPSDEATSKDGLDNMEEKACLIPSYSADYGSINDPEHQVSDSGVDNLQAEATQPFPIGDSWELINATPSSEKLNKYIIFRTLFVLLIPICSLTVGILARFYF
ncbi:multidrug and toxin extrusion protein 1-like isoform X3 [Rhopilema esculentum]|uniref:multidrug and toxin extrusion protein 1-like isoform X3 n=1 Tax=Rhopilema esculentum TaxID=499914 RepID=UPI0031D6021B